MSPYEYAKLECAYCIEGKCIRRESDCLLSAKPLSVCSHFEQSVINIPDQPKADKHPRYFELLDARNKYLDLTKRVIKKITIRTCPECGEPLRKRQRLCGKCAKKHARQAARERKQRQRQKQQAEYGMSVTL